MSSAIGEALLGLIDWAWPRVASRVDGLLEDLADAVRPDPPITIRTLDGHVLTGVIVADRGQVLLFLGVREPAPSVTPSPRSPFRDDDAPPWARDVDPYRR